MRCGFFTFACISSSSFIRGFMIWRMLCFKCKKPRIVRHLLLILCASTISHSKYYEIKRSALHNSCRVHMHNLIIRDIVTWLLKVRTMYSGTAGIIYYQLMKQGEICSAKWKVRKDSFHLDGEQMKMLLYLNESNRFLKCSIQGANKQMTTEGKDARKRLWSLMAMKYMEWLQCVLGFEWTCL